MTKKRMTLVHTSNSCNKSAWFLIRPQSSGNNRIEQHRTIEIKRRKQAASKTGNNTPIPAAPVQSNRPDTSECNYWLMKAEPDSRIVKGKDVKFSIDDLAAMPDQRSQWDGVRNYEARNLMRDKMRVGDKVLFYHSNCKQPGIAGLAEVCREGYPDHTAFDTKHPYYDPKCDPSAAPRWFMVDVRLIRKFNRFIPLDELKQQPYLRGMVLLNRGRLSVQPVTATEFNHIVKLGEDNNQ